MTTSSQTTTTARIRERRALTTRGKIMATVWTAAYSWVFISVLVDISNKINTTDMIVVSFACFLTWFKAVKFEWEDKRWSGWRNYPATVTDYEKLTERE